MLFSFLPFLPSLRTISLIIVLVMLPTLVQANATGYYALKPAAPVSGSPSSLLLQTTYVDVPAGSVFNLHLLKNHQLVTTSRLEFSSAYQSSSFIPMRIAAFLPTGSTPGNSQPIPGATLTEGVADLNAVAANPEQYQFLWTISGGAIAPPGQAVFTGSSAGATFVDFALSAGIAALRQSDQKPGSVLFYQRYQSSLPATTNDTTLSLTNTSPTDSTKVRLFFISAADCQPIEQAVCLGPQQSVRFLMSEFDPLTTGYCMAVACDATGAPTQFNWLIGNLQLRQPSPINNQPFDTSLSALAVAKRTSGALAVSQSKAELAFDDENYDRLPNQLAADNVPSQAGTGNNALATKLTLYRPVANLTGGSANVTVAFTAFNEAGQSTATTQPISCFGDLRLSTLRFNPTLASLSPVGKSGWVRIATSDNNPILGAQFTSGKYVSGAALRAISYATDYRISVPIKVPGC